MQILQIYFKKMLELKKKYSFNELSMGMSSDYLNALDFEALKRVLLTSKQVIKKGTLG